MNEGGMKQGVWLALVARFLKRSTWKGEMASAILLSTSRTWRALTKKLCFVEMRTKNQTRSITLGAFEWPELILATMLSLSHPNWRCLPTKWGYQRAQAITIGKRSCHSILIPVFLLIRRWGGQCPWNHFPLKYPLNPMVLAASVYNSRSGEKVTKESRKKERPFQWVRKTFHMVISRCNCLFKLIWWAGNTPGEIDHVLEKGLPGDHYITGKLQGANKGLEVH